MLGMVYANTCRFCLSFGSRHGSNPLPPLWVSLAVGRDGHNAHARGYLEGLLQAIITPMAITIGNAL